ncbi:MAG: type II secretion system protein GspD [Planctomycetota bacterium]|jgi:type IV pilus assembly protein PilQ
MYDNKNSKIKTKIGKHSFVLFVWCFVLVVIAAIAVADIGQVQTEAVTSENLSAVDVGGGQGDAYTGGMIRLFKSKDEEGEVFGVREALAMLASLCRINIVPSPSVDGQLAFRRLVDVTFEEAMDAILGNNFKYEQKGNVIKVYTKEEYKEIMEDTDRMIYEVFTLYYITAAEAMELIVPVLSSVGTIKGSSPAETVVPTGESISGGTGGGDTMALNDTVVILDYPEKIAEAEKLLKKLDIRPKQVLVEATILSATLTEDMDFGVDLNFAGGVSLTGTSSTAQVGSTSSLLTTSTTPISQIAAGVAGSAIESAGFATAGSSGLRIGVKSGNATAFITALEGVTDTTILANPKILAVNKQLGQVYIGTKIGYVSQTTQTQEVTTQQVEFLDTGTKLSFRPYIGDDGYIRMDIHPKDSSGTLKANDIPDEFATELATNIMIKDGQTIVIGGLFRDVVVTSRNQIPLLGDIPLVGGLFRSTADSTRREEVIVLLTVHIIEEPEETNSDARVDDVRRKRFGAKEALQWTGRARLAEDRYATAARYYVDGDTEAAMRELNYVLTLRPTYLEAIRLKERIIAETKPDEVENIERILLDNVEQEDRDKWLRR